MSTYFIICTKNAPQKLDIAYGNKPLRLQQLNKKLLPEFLIEIDKNYFYYIDGDINYKLLPQPNKNDSIDKKFIFAFQQERNTLFKSLLEWGTFEVKSGNDISIIKQVDSENNEESSKFNSVYESKTLSLKQTLTLSRDVDFDFNIEYKLTD
jgi:hypothetical protein